MTCRDCAWLNHNFTCWSQLKPMGEYRPPLDAVCPRWEPGYDEKCEGIALASDGVLRPSEPCAGQAAGIVTQNPALD